MKPENERVPSSASPRSSRWWRRSAASRPERLQRRQVGAQEHGSRSEEGGLRPGRGIEALASAILLSRSGLGSPTRPIGSFLFSGPTGVGKTELAKQLARIMGVPLIRFDMSEYMEKHTVSRLIGAPPGYVGSIRAGCSPTRFRKQPHAVLLAGRDREGAPGRLRHPPPGDGSRTLTDNNGRQSDFRHVVLIFTTNAGARDMTAVRWALASERAASWSRGPSWARRSPPSTSTREPAATPRRPSSARFSPEFRNRMDGWIAFSSLPWRW